MAAANNSAGNAAMHIQGPLAPSNPKIMSMAAANNSAGNAPGTKVLHIQGPLASSNPKIMSLPPANFIVKNGEVASLLQNGGIRIIDPKSIRLTGNNSLQPFPATGPPQHVSQEMLISALVNTNQDEEQAGVSGWQQFDQIVNYGGSNGDEELSGEDENGQEDSATDAQLPEHPPAICNMCSEQLVARLERFENLVLGKLNQVLETIQIRDHLANQGRAQNDLLPAMPFNNIADLQAFDERLKNDEPTKQQFIQKIKEIGGKNIQKMLKYAMESIMEDGVTQQVVWTLGSEDKPKISKFTFPALLIAIVRDAFPGTKIKDIEGRIADWLRRGGDRIKAATTAANKRQLRQENEDK